MCVNHLNIINPARRLSMDLNSRFQLQVPCGECFECKRKRLSEYLLRILAHAQGTWKKGGYVLFDTLTYRDDTLPHLSDNIPALKGKSYDYPCFSRRDIRLFLMSLRSKLMRAGFDVVSNLTYYLVSEYGSDDRFTHRPHYHILLFVKSCGLSSLELSKFVAESWPHGRTDGIPYRSALYVLQNTFNSLSENALKSFNYVAKYVNKSSVFSKRIEKRINYVLDVDSEAFQTCQYVPLTRSDEVFCSKMISIIERFNFDWLRLRPSLYKGLARLCREFHLQSKGFGLALLDGLDFVQVAKDGYFKVVDRDRYVRPVAIPMYYYRKMFAELVEDFRGSAHWELNELGKSLLSVKNLQSFEIVCSRFVSWLEDMKLHNQVVYDNFVLKLNGRSLDDFCGYLLFAKGRLYNSLDDILDFSLDSVMCGVDESNKYIYIYKAKKDFYENFVSPVYFGDDTCNSLSIRKYRQYRPLLCDSCQFMNRHVVSQSTLPMWYCFDDLWNLYLDNIKDINNYKQKASERIEELRLIFNH